MDRNDFKPHFMLRMSHKPLSLPRPPTPTSARLLTVSAGVVLVSARSARLYVHSMSAGCLPGQPALGIKQDHFRLVLSVSGGGVCCPPPPLPRPRGACVYFSPKILSIFMKSFF